MLTTANHLVLNKFGNVFQKNLLYNLPRDQREADKSLSLPGYSALLKSRAIFNFLQSAGTSSNYHGLFKIDMSGLTVTLASSLSIFDEVTSYFPSDPLDLCVFSLFNSSLSCYLSSFYCSKPPHWFHGP